MKDEKGGVEPLASEGTSRLLSDNMNEVLSYALEHDMIDLSYVRELVEMSKKKELLLRHPYAVWQGKDGKWYTHFPDEERGRVLRQRRTEEELADLICEFWKEKTENPTLKDIFQQWISRKLEYKEIQKGSADRYTTDFERFFVRSGFAERHIKQITEDDIEEFVRRQIVQHELSTKTFSGLRIIVKGIFQYAKKRKWTSISISEFFGDLEISRKSFKKTIKESEDEVLSEDEVPIIVNYLRENSSIWDLGVLLVLQTGLRVGELSALKREDWKDNILKIRRTEAREKDSRGKNILYIKSFTKTDAGMRNLILSASGRETMRKIVELNPDGEYLFQNEHGKRIRGNTFNKHLDIVLSRLGMRHRSIHKLRKTYCTMLINSGCEDALVMNQLGHASIETSRKHYYFSNRNMENQIRQIEKAIVS